MRNSGWLMAPALFLIPLIAIFRVLLAWHPLTATWLVGAMPLSAVAWCAGLYLPRRLAIALPLGILAMSDAVIDAHFGAAFWTTGMLVRYLALALVAISGLALRGRAYLPVTIAGALAGSVFFYLVTNFFCWLGSPDYPQTLAGLAQSLTTGLPGYLPSWYFFRNSLVSDGLYSIVFVACLRAGETAGNVERQPVRA